MLECNLEFGRNAIEIGVEQSLREIPRSLLWRPRHARLLVGAEQHAALFLADVDLTSKVERHWHFLARRSNVRCNLGHVFGDEIHVLHGEHGQFDADHTADFAGPQSASVHDVFGVD